MNTNKRKSSLHILAIFFCLGLALSTGRASVIMIDPAGLTFNFSLNFDDFDGDPDLPLNVDGTIQGVDREGNVVISFAERFAGQDLSFLDGVGNPIPPSTNTPTFDVLSNNTTGPLSLAIGAAGQNIAIDSTGGDAFLVGLGPIGIGDPDGVGEGAVATLFATDQSQFGFSIFGTNPQSLNSAVIDFFARDGSLLDSLLLSSLVDGALAFETASGAREIAGFSIWNNDNGGIGYDEFLFEVSEPGTILLIGLGLLAFVMVRSGASDAAYFPR